MGKFGFQSLSLLSYINAQNGVIPDELVMGFDCRSDRVRYLEEGKNMTIRLDGQVAIVTGSGQGLGRCHALALAERGAKVVVNDLGGADGESENANAVVAEIKVAGGEAMAHGANVANMDQVSDMVAKTMDAWGRVDILINNAGILRDKTFAKMPLDDFRLVVEVHLMGTANCTKAVSSLRIKLIQ